MERDGYAQRTTQDCSSKFRNTYWSPEKKKLFDEMLAAVGLLHAAKEAAKQPQHQKKKHLI